MKFFIPITIFFLLFSLQTIGQNEDYLIAQNRQYAHYKLAKIKQQVLPPSKEGGLDAMLTQQIYKQLNAVEKQIELDTTPDNKKNAYLFGFGQTVEGAGLIYKHATASVKLIMLPQIITAWHNAYLLDKKDESIATLMNGYPYNVCSLLLKTVSFQTNPDYADCKNALTLRRIQPNDSTNVNSFNVNADLPFSDSVINMIARTEPDVLYNYAQATESKLGKRLQANNDTAVKLIYTLANNGNGQLFMPFYDNLLKGKITIADIKKETKDDLSYYRLLIKTAIEYAGRAAQGDTPTAWNKLREMLHTKAYLPFVNTINGLHENTNNSIRYKIIQNLSAEELYYLIVSCETEIFTSSYIYVYNRIWQRMQTPTADALLALVNRDRYKKFVAMAANYNMLEDFLKRMDKERATDLMTGFVDNLDKGTDGNLEDAVDVANSYASITSDSLRNLMMSEVVKNYDQSLANYNKRGQMIYRLEKLILASSDTIAGINLSDSLGILPIFKMPNKLLTDKYGRVILRMFFYNDKSVMSMFNAFMGGFNKTNWKVISNKNWVTVNSTKGKSVIIYANKASTKEDFSDAANQKALSHYLEINKLNPTITIHRGHSYTADLTIKQMAPTSKIVFLGSCGGYHQMDDILSIAPDAQVIATKQIGKTAINQPFFSLLTEKLRTGDDIDWIPFWKQFGKNANNDGFDDYIPPYKNLGAIFIKAYKKEGGE